MRTKFQVPSFRLRVPCRDVGAPRIQGFSVRAGFTLIEVLVVIALLSFIVLALMTVFGNTQAVLRANLTQNDVLGSGRQVMEMITRDLETMSPCDEPSNAFVWPDRFNTNNNLNFFNQTVRLDSPPSPFYQSLPGSTRVRTNLLETFFSLSRDNLDGRPSWIGTGYLVVTNAPDGAPYALYRFYQTTNAATGTPASLFNAYAQFQYTNTAVWSHLLNGVVDLRVRAFNSDGVWLTNGFHFREPVRAQNVRFGRSIWGQTPCAFYSNSIPASVEVEMGLLEDGVRRHLGALGGSIPLQRSYLDQHAGQVHLFRQRVWIRNCDPSVYQ